jgi:hypothetical protein
VTLPSNTRQRWSLDAIGVVEVFDLDRLLAVTPAGSGGVRSVLRKSIDDLGDYARLVLPVKEAEYGLG